MVSVARPWTKWAAEVERVEDLPTAVRRAVQMALTPPTGPVFLSLPLDVQMAQAELDLTPPRPLDTRVRPPVERNRASGRGAVVGQAIRRFWSAAASSSATRCANWSPWPSGWARR